MRSLFRRHRIVATCLKITCVALGIVIIGEFVVDASRVSVESPTQSVPSKTLSSTDTEPPFEGWVTTVEEHPVFTPNRENPAAIAAATTIPDSAPEITSRLAGMMINPGIREALFAHGGDRPTPVREGQEIDGWTVSKIAMDHVVLKSRYGERSLEPTKSTEAAIPPAVSPSNKRLTPQS